MTAPLTTLEIDELGVATLRMHDEPGKNALSFEMVRELEERSASIAHDDRVKALVIAGLDEYFSTGATRAVLQEIASGRATPRDLLLPRALLDVPVPVVAAMTGHAVGGGLALGICADIIIAARESRYGATFIQYGFTPGMGLTALLEHQVGAALAYEMLLTGQTFRGSHFESRGAFNYVLPRSEVLPKAMDLAAALADKPRSALVSLKMTLSAKKRSMFESARSTELLMHAITFAAPGTAELIDELLP